MHGPVLSCICSSPLLNPCSVRGLIHSKDALRGICTFAQVVDGDDDGMLREGLHQADDVLAGLQPGRELVPAIFSATATFNALCYDFDFLSSTFCTYNDCFQCPLSVLLLLSSYRTSLECACLGLA